MNKPEKVEARQRWRFFPFNKDPVDWTVYDVYGIGQRCPKGHDTSNVGCVHFIGGGNSLLWDRTPNLLSTGHYQYLGPGSGQPTVCSLKQAEKFQAAQFSLGPELAALVKLVTELNLEVKLALHRGETVARIDTGRGAPGQPNVFELAIGDWLVVDKDGKCALTTNEGFRERFLVEG